jgi:arylsulfatase A-like enzyme
MAWSFLSRIGLLLLAVTGAQALPNIVYILADDLGIGDVSGYNPASKVATPALDGLMREGMRFTDAHSGSSVCTPTRYGILTGRYCWRSKLKSGVLDAKSPRLIEDGRLTVAGLLKQKGYATACIGKWHLGLDWADPKDWSKGFANGPRAVGFEYYFGIPASLDMEDYAYLEADKVVQAPTDSIKASGWPAFYRGGKIAPGFKHEEVLPNVTAKAVAWLQDRKAAPAQPFFLYLALPSPHTPHVPNAAFKGKSQAGARGDYVAETDWAVGQVLKALDSLGFSGNTLLIAASDNGAHDKTFRQYGHSPHMGFRGEKADIFEAGHHIPFVVRWPRVVRANSASAEVICLTDFLATAAAVVSVPLPDNAGEDSYSLLPVLLGSTLKGPLREATVHHSSAGTFAIRKGDWKLALDNMGSGGFTVPVTVKGPGTLFDMAKNPGEDSLKDQYAAQPGVVKELRALLAKYQAEGRSVALPRQDGFWQDPAAIGKWPGTIDERLRVRIQGNGLLVSGAGEGAFTAVLRALDGHAVWAGKGTAQAGRAVLPPRPLPAGLYTLELSGPGWNRRACLLADGQVGDGTGRF